MNIIALDRPGLAATVTQVLAFLANLPSSAPRHVGELEVKVLPLPRKRYRRNVKDVEIEYDPYYGQVIVVRTSLSARRALHLLRILIDHIPQQDRSIPSWQIGRWKRMSQITTRRMAWRNY